MAIDGFLFRFYVVGIYPERIHPKERRIWDKHLAPSSGIVSFVFLIGCIQPVNTFPPELTMVCLGFNISCIPCMYTELGTPPSGFRARDLGLASLLRRLRTRTTHCSRIWAPHALSNWRTAEGDGFWTSVWREPSSACIPKFQIPHLRTLRGSISWRKYHSSPISFYHQGVNPLSRHPHVTFCILLISRTVLALRQH